MSNILEQASLVLVPSGYKAGTVYSQIPIDGEGDLQFTRSNDTATRVNSAGLIEKVRTNLAAYSSDFSQEYTLLNATISTNTITDPFGTSLADSHLETATTDIHAGFNDYTVISGTELTYSIYAKSIGGRNIQILGSSGFNGPVALVDLSNGTLLSGSTADAKVTSVGDGWYRISITATTTTTTARIIVYSANGTSTSFLGDITKGVYLFGRQLEYGVATDYIPTTTAAVSVGMTANVPRLDYSGGGCPKLLLEPQRTNALTYSEQFNNAAWTKSGVTVTANQAVSPDGYLNADTLEKVSGSGGTDYYYIVNSSTSNTTNTFSVFAKYKEGSGIIWLLGKNSNTFAFFNLQTGTALSASAGMTTKVENYGNGWYRCSFTQDYTGASDYTFGVGLCLVDGTPNYDATSAATQGTYIYGAQFEAGSYPTSYIPTLGAAVTRGADACSKTGISSLIGQTEGTLFIDLNYVPLQNEARLIIVTETNIPLNNRLIVNVDNTTNRVSVISRQSGSSTNGSIGDSAATALITGNNKIALGYKSGDSVLYINGVSVATNTQSFTFAQTLNDLFLMTSEITFNTANTGITNQALLFPTRLTNTQLAELTTL